MIFCAKVCVCVWVKTNKEGMNRGVVFARLDFVRYGCSVMCLWCDSCG